MDCRQNPWNLLVAVNSTGGASGEIYIDDGVSVKPNATLYVILTAVNGSLSAQSLGNYSVGQPLGNITVLGIQAGPKNVMFNGGNYTWDWINNTLFVTSFGGGSAWNNPWTLSWK
jgi:alpha-glucosidase